MICKADYHILFPTRHELKTAEKDGKGESLSYREMKKQIQQQFGSAQQQRMLKKNTEKGVFDHGDDLDTKQKSIPIPAVRKRKR